jgi:hypothetical protein
LNTGVFKFGPDIRLRQTIKCAGRGMTSLPKESREGSNAVSALKGVSDSGQPPKSHVVFSPCKAPFVVYRPHSNH